MGASSGSVAYFPRRAFGHCMRALLVLRRGPLAEEALVEAVTAPLAKATLTAGGSGTIFPRHFNPDTNPPCVYSFNLCNPIHTLSYKPAQSSTICP